MKKVYIGVVVILLVGVIVWVGISSQKKFPNNEAVNNETVKPISPISQVNYLCDAGKTINAKYYQGAKAPEPQPGEPPTPTGSVRLVLSDGRQPTLPQTISASGVRYAASNEAIIFWNKGNSVFITENDVQTYSGCIAIAKNPGNLPQVYESATSGFSIRYPAGYIVNSSYQYQALGPGKEINGVKFTIPLEMATGTNLSGFDTGVSIEKIPNTRDCKANLFIDSRNASTSFEFEKIDNETPYSFVHMNDAGAGNFYDETVWAIPGTNPCAAIRYFIHSTNIDNYPPRTIKEFNRQALISQFDAIRRTLVLSP